MKTDTLKSYADFNPQLLEQLPRDIQAFSWDQVWPDLKNHHSVYGSRSKGSQSHISDEDSCALESQCSSVSSMESDDSFIVITSSPLQSPKHFEPNDPPKNSSLGAFSLLHRLSYLTDSGIDSQSSHNIQLPFDKRIDGTDNSTGILGSFSSFFASDSSSNSDMSTFQHITRTISGAFQTFKDNSLLQRDGINDGEAQDIHIWPTCTPLGCIPLQWNSYYDMRSQIRCQGKKISDSNASKISEEQRCRNTEKAKAAYSKQLDMLNHEGLDSADYC